MAYKFTRLICKRIKKYDKEDIEEFVQSVYLKGLGDKGETNYEFYRVRKISA